MANFGRWWWGDLVRLISFELRICDPETIDRDRFLTGAAPICRAVLGGQW